MKDKIFVFIIGLLVGAIITSAGFLMYQKNNQNNFSGPNGAPGQMMEMPDGQTPPEKPESEEDDSNRPEPPSKENSSTTNTTEE